MFLILVSLGSPTILSRVVDGSIPFATAQPLPSACALRGNARGWCSRAACLAGNRLVRLELDEFLGAALLRLVLPGGILRALVR